VEAADDGEAEDFVMVRLALAKSLLPSSVVGIRAGGRDIVRGPAGDDLCAVLDAEEWIVVAEGVGSMSLSNLIELCKGKGRKLRFFSSSY
jgi:hypothetical protein